MSKVLIVEDEKEIRHGLAAHPIWQELGVEQVLTADDGITGLEMIGEFPDIRLVVTDIRMKQVSGLEFIQKLHEELDFEGKVIILSGYNDFQYARKAMNYGVLDYLLKPVDLTELKQVARKALLLLEDEKKRQSSLSLMEDAMPKLREKWLQEVVDRAAMASVAEPSTWNRLQQYGLLWLGSDKLVMMVVEADNLKSYAQQGYSVKERDRIGFAIGNVLEHSLMEQAEQAGSYVWFRSPDGGKWVVVFGQRTGSRASFNRWFGEFKALLAERIKIYVKASATFVLTGEGSLDSLPQLYEEALHSLMQAKIYGEDESARELEQEAGPAYRDLDLLLEPKALVDLLGHGEPHDVQEAVELFPALVREWGITLIRDLHQRLFEWLLEVFEEARKAGWKRDEWSKKPLLLWESIEAFDTLEALQPLLLKYLLQVNAELQGHSNSNNQILQRAEQYIKEHYTEPITVQTVADHVFLSPEWLSTLFKKHAGTTFLDYVTQLRMEKAKELLQDVSLKIYQIGPEVGYRDTVYFSKLFKKKFGCTPKEYRNSMGIYGNE
ncbi:helix-turn-helix domain-containing protein [Paenibacillus filicis]|uniref:Helix-turn-helix domain-containing protein n=1 Tax=Paenibacillus filicis TaxID=669464 RepID=A0ABU9DNW5_9BACL